MGKREIKVSLKTKLIYIISLIYILKIVFQPSASEFRLKFVSGMWAKRSARERQKNIILITVPIHFFPLAFNTLHHSTSILSQLIFSHFSRVRQSVSIVYDGGCIMNGWWWRALDATEHLTKYTTSRGELASHPTLIYVRAWFSVTVFVSAFVRH